MNQRTKIDHAPLFDKAYGVVGKRFNFDATIALSIVQIHDFRKLGMMNVSIYPGSPWDPAYKGGFFPSRPFLAVDL